MDTQWPLFSLEFGAFFCNYWSPQIEKKQVVTGSFKLIEHVTTSGPDLRFIARVWKESNLESDPMEYLLNFLLYYILDLPPTQKGSWQIKTNKG